MSTRISQASRSRGARGWARKRRIEALAGLCAREALRALGSPHADAPIAADASRAPVWPPGVVGSITYRGFASAAVAHAGSSARSGSTARALHARPRATSRRAPRAPGEGGQLRARARSTDRRGDGGLLREERVQVPAPRCGGTSASTRRVVDAAGGMLVIRLTEGLTAEFAEGHELRGRYAVTETTCTPPSRCRGASARAVVASARAYLVLPRRARPDRRRLRLFGHQRLAAHDGTGAGQRREHGARGLPVRRGAARPGDAAQARRGRRRRVGLVRRRAVGRPRLRDPHRGQNSDGTTGAAPSPSPPPSSCARAARSA